MNNGKGKVRQRRSPYQLLRPEDRVYRFEAAIELMTMGDFRYTALYLPEDLAARLPFGKSKRLRVQLNVGPVNLEGAFVPSGGRWFLMFAKKHLEKGNWQPGDVLSVAFKILDQDAVSMCEELQRALDIDAEALAAWEKLTPGRRRNHAYHIGSAKLPETRHKRIHDLLSKLRSP